MLSGRQREASGNTYARGAARTSYFNVFFLKASSIVRLLSLRVLGKIFDFFNENINKLIYWNNACIVRQIFF